MIERQSFIRNAASGVFGGSMTNSQREGIELILDEWERRREEDLNKLACILGTVKHETNATMRPVREAYWLSEAWRRENLRYWPYYGRGLVQLTWERNYLKMTNLLRSRFPALNLDMVREPDQALLPEVAVAVTFEGMFRADSGFGDFTGLSLEDFFKPGQPPNFVGSRMIINGTDRAAEIAQIEIDFLRALTGERLDHVLQYGSKGDDVRRLQGRLEALGFDVGSSGADGDFGEATKLAVSKFQVSRGLMADGIVGPLTWEALNR